MVHFPSEKLRCSSSTSLLFSEPFLIENSSFSSSIIPSLGVADEGGGEAKGKGMQPSDDLQQQVARRPHCLLFSVFSFSVSFFFGYKGVINIKRRKRSRIEKPPPQTIFFSGQQKFLLLVLHLFRSKNHLFPWWNVTKIRNVSNSTGSFIPAIHSPVTFPSSWNDYRLVFFALLR